MQISIRTRISRVLTLGCLRNYQQHPSYPFIKSKSTVRFVQDVLQRKLYKKTWASQKIAKQSKIPSVFDSLGNIRKAQRLSTNPFEGNFLTMSNKQKVL